MKVIYGALTLAAALTTVFAGPNDSNWIQMLRKGDTKLSDWTPKIQGHAAGENPYNSFSYGETSDGQPRLIVTDTVSNTSSYGYGHLFYKTAYSDYIVRAKYHFPTKESFAGGAGSWTIQNNGLMLHCQSAASMDKGQDYPKSIENQLIGYWSYGDGSPPNTTTSNLCLVNTSVNYHGQWYSDGTGHHCTQSKFHSLAYDSSTTPAKGANSTNATWPGKDIWEYAMDRVIDSTSMTFYMRSRPDTAWDSVLGVTQIRLGLTNTSSGPGSTTALGSGYISIQMEGTSTEFASIEVLNLVGCMTKTDTAYRAYFIKDDPKQCSGSTNIAARQYSVSHVFSLSGSRILATAEILQVDIIDVSGARIASLRGNGQSFLDLSDLRPGVYSLRVQTRKGSAQAVYAKM